ncbi:MAG TPA: hypothetical protein VF399_12305 [bacterium]
MESRYRFQTTPLFSVRATANANWNDPPLHRILSLLGSAMMVLPSEKGLAI